MKSPTESTTKPLNYRLLLGKFLCLAAIMSLGFYLSFHDVGAVQPESGPQLQDRNEQLPVILLTGFEPFGKERPLNPSWEGIKALHGQEWKGHRLVCKELPVLWGAPLEHLQKWIASYQPVAVFSFGQGGKNSFAVECKAANERGKHKDNHDDRPPTPTIVENGPSQFDASINGEQFVRLLAEKGHEIRLSKKAGQYLCEETLYTLEYLKSSKQLEATVMFCHVPPLNTKIRAQLVTAEYVQQFVQDVLGVWYTLYHTETALGQGKGDSKETRPQDLKDVKEFIGRYFRTWSEQDMKGYDGCFLTDASIQHIDAKGRLSTTARADFIASQRDYHRNAPHRTTEVPESIDVRFEEKLARVVVFWKLTAGPRLEYGYDHFTLIKIGGSWRIVNLVFYGTPPPAKKKAG